MEVKINFFFRKDAVGIRTEGGGGGLKRINTVYNRAQFKRGYLMIIKDNFSFSSLNSYVVTRHLNRLMRRFR